MFDDSDKNGPEFDPPNEDVVYARYLETCKRLGVEPMPRDRATALMAEWSAVLATHRHQPPLH